MIRDSGWQQAHGKIILFGEHAVVYGAKAIAASIPNAISARAFPVAGKATLNIPDWSIECNLTNDAQTDDLLSKMFRLICRQLDLNEEGFSVELKPSIPAASGLGASAAVAVASIRAINKAFELDLTEIQVNDLAFQCEKLAHGNPSGLDNTLATYGGLLEFQRIGDDITFSNIPGVPSIKLIVALSGKKGYTAETVARVAGFREQNKPQVDALFERIEQARLVGKQALIDSDLPTLAHCFEVNQGCLSELGVSCSEIEQVIAVGKKSSALGAKLTGSGDGGAVILLSTEPHHEIREQLRSAGFESLIVNVQSTP